MSRSDHRLAYVVAAGVILVWGATPAATAIAITDIDAVTVGMLRTVIAAALLLPFALVSGQPLPRRRGQWGSLVMSSAGGFVGFTILFSLGLRQTSTAHAALIIAGAPVLTGLIGFILEGAWPKRIWWAGALVAFLGEVILIWGRSAAPGPHAATVQGDLLVVAATVFASAGYAAGGRLAAQIGTRAATSWGIGFAGLALIPWLWVRIDDTVWVGVSWLGWGALLYLALMTSVIGYAGWYWAIGRAGVARIAPIQFAQPVVSLVLAVAVLDEAITARIALATATIVLGIVITRSGTGPTLPGSRHENSGSASR